MHVRCTGNNGEGTKPNPGATLSTRNPSGRKKLQTLGACCKGTEIWRDAVVRRKQWNGFQRPQFETSRLVRYRPRPLK